MTSYIDIKSAGYISQNIKFAEELLGVQFKKVGNNKYAAFCPFHYDTQDSFRVYVNKKVDFSKYTKIMFDDVVFFISEDADYKGFEAKELADLGVIYVDDAFPVSIQYSLFLHVQLY